MSGQFKGVYQRGDKDCVRASVASLFGVSLDDVPNFRGEDWGDDLQKWLRQRGMAFINVVYREGISSDLLPRGFTLGAVKSPSLPDPWKHCIVCKDGIEVWCPIRGTEAPKREVEEYTIIYSLNPALTQIEGQKP